MKIDTVLNRRFLASAAIAGALLTGAVACSDDTDDGTVDTETTVDLDPGAGAGAPGDSDDETTTTEG